jgi:dolichol-phosphate mannosyltransferase
VVDDGSTDETWPILQKLKEEISTLSPVQNGGQHGFGRAIIHGLDHMNGDAAFVMMADESDDCHDVVRYWQTLNEGWIAYSGAGS